MVFVLLYPARGFGGALIKWQTRSKYSHAAVLFVDGDSKIVFESIQFEGVLTRKLNAEDRKADWFKVNANYTQDDILRAKRWARKQVGKPYDWTMVFRFVTRRQETRKSKGKWFCSEYGFVIITKLLEKLGMPLLARTEPYEVSPGLFSRVPVLQKVPHG